MVASNDGFVPLGFKLSLKIRDDLNAAALQAGCTPESFLSFGLEQWLSDENFEIVRDCIFKQFKRDASDIYKGCLYLPYLDIYPIQGRVTEQCYERVISLANGLKQSRVACASMLAEHFLENRNVNFLGFSE